MVLAKASVVFSRNLCMSGSLFGLYNSSHSSTEGSFPPSPRKVYGGGRELYVPLSMVELLMLITSVWEPEKLPRPGGGGCWRRNKKRKTKWEWGEGENADWYKLFNGRRYERRSLD